MIFLILGSLFLSSAFSRRGCGCIHLCRNSLACGVLGGLSSWAALMVLLKGHMPIVMVSHRATYSLQTLYPEGCGRWYSLTIAWAHSLWFLSQMLRWPNLENQSVILPQKPILQVYLLYSVFAWLQGRKQEFWYLNKMQRSSGLIRWSETNVTTFQLMICEN